MYIGPLGRAIRDPIRFDAAEKAGRDTGPYERFFPYYAELCALSEIRKKPGLGAVLRSGMGGHSLFYLSGVRLDRTAGYPTLKLCEPDARPASYGVGISVNAHYRNANWIAAEGRDFVFRGALRAGERLTRDSYERTQEQAKAMGVLDGIEFHEHLFRDKPRDMSRRDYMYEISIASDYAINFGRDIYRAKVPLDRQRTAIIVDFLNALNVPFRDGKRIYRWRVLNDNCSHVTHNALAAAGIWSAWPTGQFFAIAAFDFPVPKNEFVDLMGRANDLPIERPSMLYRDAAARTALLDLDVLPCAPGGLVSTLDAVAENEIYETDRLRLIFYDNPFWGNYHRCLARIFREPRYFDLRANGRHFAAAYRTAQDNLPAAKGDGAMARFIERYESYLDREMTRLHGQLEELSRPSAARAEALM